MANTSRSSKPLGAPRRIFFVPSARATDKATLTSADAMQADRSKGYGEEYVRLVFDASQSTSELGEASPQQKQQRLPAAAPHANQLPPMPPAVNTITDAQATAALAQLPEHPPARGTTAAPLHTAPVAASSLSAKHQQQYSSPTASEAPPALAEAPQSQAWWSTLSGTLSAYNSLQGTVIAGAGYHNSRLQTLQSTQSLNDTLGRADRAAMVLSMSYPQHSTEGAKGAESSTTGAAASVDDYTCAKDDVETGGSADPVAAAVAALAARISRAAEKATTGMSGSVGLAEITASTLAHQNTIQELHDTLRMTEVHVMDPLTQKQQTCGASPFADAPDDGSLHRDGRSSLVARPRLANTDRDHHDVPPVSIVVHRQQQQHCTPQSSRGDESEKASGLVGVGTRRTRDALARLYTTNGASTPVPAGVATAPAQPPRSFSLLNGPEPSFAAPVQPVSTDDTLRMMPWRCETLSLATVERRYGPLEAAHAAHASRPSKRKCQQEAQSPPRRGNLTPAHRGSAGTCRSQSLQQQQQPASTTSSVSSSVFSCVSLTSSIFLRELGDSEALRKSYISLINGAKALPAAHQGSVSNAARHREKQGPPQMQREAAVEAVALYRREQQRLYASHLATASRALVGADDEGNGPDAAEPHLDVDFLFADYKPKVKDYVLDKSKTRAPQEGHGATRPAALECGKVVAAKGADDVTASLASPRSTRDPLQEAMQACHAVLRRHIQESPAWERLLHKVRQWCDRTTIIVRLENGECVEQAGMHPPQLSRFKKAPPPQASPCPSTKEADHLLSARRVTSPDVVAGGRDGLGQPDLPPSLSADAAADFSTDCGSEQRRPRYEYVDDPAVAHDALMQQVAQEVEDIQRRNALDRCRQRQLRWQAAVNESALVVPETSQLPISSSAPQLDRFAFGARRSIGTPSTWTKASYRSETSSVFVHSTGSNLDATPSDATSAGPPQLLPALFNTPFATRPPHHGYGVNTGRKGSFLVSAAAAAQNEVRASRHTTYLASRRSSESVVAPPVGGPTSLHADLCSKLQTWGTPIEEDDADDYDEEGADLASPLNALERETDGTLVLWKMDMPPLSEEETKREVERRRAFASFGKQDEVFPARRGARGSRASSLKPASRSSFSRLSSVERDLLALVLTCGSSSRTSSSAANSGLLSLLYSIGGSSGWQRKRCSSVMREDRSVVAAHHALVAIQTILRDGFGVHALPKKEDVAEVLGECARDQQAEDSCADILEGPQVSPPWEELLTAALAGYNVFDFYFLKHIHECLWTYEAWRQSQDRARPSDLEWRRRRSPEVTVLPAPTAFNPESPPRVYPLTVFISHVAPPLRKSRISNADEGPPVAPSPSTSPSVAMDAAELFCALATTPTLVSWLLDAHQSSPTSSWMDIVDSMPSKQQQEWHAVVAECLDRAENEAPKHSPATPQAGLPQSTSSSARTTSASSQRSRSVSPTLDKGAAVPIAFSCDVSVAVPSMLWRQRLFHDLLKRSLDCMESTPEKASFSESSVIRSRIELPISPAPPSTPFPCVGSTPYLPDEEGRINYPLDMRNGYLFSSLTREDVESRVVPQLNETRRQYTEALRMARSAAVIASASNAAKASAEGPSALLSKTSASLPVALQQRVHLDRLMQIEQRFMSLLSSMWNQEQTICAFNEHVGAFNEFTRAEQKRWGPLYCSSLTVAYCVCEELAEKKMENLSADLLPFVSVVATFMGCRGGHREMRAKLRAVMLDLVERAKKVQVHVNSQLWQGKRAQVLSEAVAAAQLAPRRAGAVVSCLATESDVIGVPLTEVALPAVQLKHTQPLAPPEG
ncbi:hypothetical protein ABL78_3685 [Leptomonas seymouri]|uniref:Uncharacterized protein n=1 Tax=Leptomonas seymouri TaxID=5684 RepID=A0A0N1I5S5_LEPSE|nr:hypothetical protein ABL78_3685 [Leptomonas seymouri]|eukprot:KPI87215.1 hypothetical protein ABL78_3685 [Leptomonas seymouri]